MAKSQTGGRFKLGDGWVDSDNKPIEEDGTLIQEDAPKPLTSASLQELQAQINALKDAQGDGEPVAKKLGRPPSS